MDPSPRSNPTSPTPLSALPTNYILEPYAQQLWEIDRLQRSYAEHAKTHKYAQQNARRGRQSFDGCEHLFGVGDEEGDEGAGEHLAKRRVVRKHADSAVSFERPDLEYAGYYVRSDTSTIDSAEKEYAGYYVKTDALSAPPSGGTRGLSSDKESSKQKVLLSTAKPKRVECSPDTHFFPPWYADATASKSQHCNDKPEWLHNSASYPCNRPPPSAHSVAEQSPSISHGTFLIQALHKRRKVIMPKQKRRRGGQYEDQKRLRAIARAFVREFRNALPWFPMHKASRLSALGVSLVLRGRSMEERRREDGESGRVSFLGEREREVGFGERAKNVIVSVKEVRADSESENEDESEWTSPRRKIYDPAGRWIGRKQRVERSGNEVDRWLWHWT